MADIARRVQVTGRVQGVGFRAWTAEQARALGVRGWVRNEADGSVSALLAGPEEAVTAMIDALWHGPRFAQVRGVAAEDAADAAPEGFDVRR